MKGRKWKQKSPIRLKKERKLSCGEVKRRKDHSGRRIKWTSAATSSSWRHLQALSSCFCTADLINLKTEILQSHKGVGALQERVLFRGTLTKTNNHGDFFRLPSGHLVQFVPFEFLWPWWPRTRANGCSYVLTPCINVVSFIKCPQDNCSACSLLEKLRTRIILTTAENWAPEPDHRSICRSAEWRLLNRCVKINKESTGSST